MSVAIVTGSLGLVGSEASRHFTELGMDVVGIDNNMRETFFGKEASTFAMEAELCKIKNYHHRSIDIRQAFQMERIFEAYGKDISLVIHAAAQPSHDWATSAPLTDWAINATATSQILEMTRAFCPEAVFIFLSTNKVYGDKVNSFTFTEQKTRYENSMYLFAGNFGLGVSESLPIDESLHSLFGASKLAADVLVQEYGRYFGMKTACFRCGCITGPNHAGVEAHGFLSYLMKCAVTEKPYTVYGYKGKQVRDNIHSSDLVCAFEEFFAAPRIGEVYNMGGGRESNCSILEAREMCVQLTDKALTFLREETPRRGDHIWWISDTSKFKSHFPEWKITRTVPDILKEIYEVNSERWTNA